MRKGFALDDKRLKNPGGGGYFKELLGRIRDIRASEKVLIYFDKLYSAMGDEEKRQLMESLISEIQIYEERQPNGQWLKSIKFKLPIIAEDMSLSLDKDAHIETVALLVRNNGTEADGTVN